MNDAAPPEYHGVYERVCLPPTLLVSVGRWGAKVLDRFFCLLEEAYRVRRSGTDHPGAPVAPRSCFGRIAIHWAGNDPVPRWTELNLCSGCSPESASAERVLALTLPPGAEHWSLPRCAVERVLPGLFDELAPVLEAEVKRIIHGDHMEGVRSLGITPLDDVTKYPRWVVLAGSLWEAETGSIIRQLRHVVEEAVPGLRGTVRYLYFLDAGPPDDPCLARQPWAPVPPELVAQFEAAVSTLNFVYPAEVVFVASPDARGNLLAEDTRAAIAAGYLRSMFWSNLLYCPREQGHWPADRRERSNLLALRTVPNPAGMEQTAAFLEIALHVDNIPRLVVRQWLAEWAARALAGGARPVSFMDLLGEVRERLAKRDYNAQALVGSWLERWIGREPERFSRATLFELKGWLEVEHLRPEPAPEPASEPAPLPWWKRLLIWLGWMTPPEVPPHSPIDWKARSEFCGALLRWTESALALLERMETPGTDFESTEHDYHHDRENWDDRTVVLRLRRLPLRHHTPVWAVQQIDALSDQVPALLAEWKAGGVPDLELFESLLRERGEAFVKSRMGSLTSEGKAGALGIAAWIDSDPQLRQLAAREILARMMPAWQALAGWEGLLTVVDYTSPECGMPGEETAVKAWRGIARELSGMHINGRRPLCGGIDNRDPLNPENILWARWPAHQSFGLLWTEHQRGRPSFRDAWIHADLREVARVWREAHPEEAAWVEFEAGQEE